MVRSYILWFTNFLRLVLPLGHGKWHMFLGHPGRLCILYGQVKVSTSFGSWCLVVFWIFYVLWHLGWLFYCLLKYDANVSYCTCGFTFFFSFEVHQVCLHIFCAPLSVHTSLGLLCLLGTHLVKAHLCPVIIFAPKINQFPCLFSPFFLFLFI